MSSHLKAELAATCSTLGRLHKGEYLIEPECLESVKDLIRYLKRDNEAHEIRRYLGESKVLQNDLIHIVKSCPEEESDLFDVTLRLLINLTTPTMLFYGEEIPAEKIGRNIYLSLIGYLQEYKAVFCDVEFWSKICGKLTDLFEKDWTERSADEGIQIERMLMLLRNVLQIPADEESERRPDNDITVHDKVLWALRQAQILELLLFVSSNENEQQYFLNLLEIFSLILREQNPVVLATCDSAVSTAERRKDTEELVRAREAEKKSRNKYLNMRNFNATFVMKGVKSLANNDVVCHKSLEKVNELEVCNFGKKRTRTRRNRVPVESEPGERRSTCSVRLFLKEFSTEFLTGPFNQVMTIVKGKIDSGKSLTHDQTYYFWALRFFLKFAAASNSDPDLVKNFLSPESFHFLQTSMDNAFDHLISEKKKTMDWVKRIHLILKAYRTLLETLMWMDCSKNPLTRSISRQIKSQIFYVVEYREMTLHLLLQYDPTKFSVSYLQDLMETAHLFIKLLEEYSKQTKLTVQKVTRRKPAKGKKKVREESKEEKWEKIKDEAYDLLLNETTFPEIPPFDAALETPIDEQKGRAMKLVQKYLHEGQIRESVGLLWSARQVWPENECFGGKNMSVEDEVMALQEICLADLDEIEIAIPEKSKPVLEEDEDEVEEEEEEESEKYTVVEQDFDIMDYKKRLVHRKVVEGCGILLKNYKKNSDQTNHCVVKMMHRIGWECCMPAMLFQASIFWSLLAILKDTERNYEEMNTFTANLLRKFRKLATGNPVVFLELLFWKDHHTALEIQHGYQPQEKKAKGGEGKKKGKKREAKRKRKNRGMESEVEEIREVFENYEIEEEGRTQEGSNPESEEEEEEGSNPESEEEEEEGSNPESEEEEEEEEMQYGGSETSSGSKRAREGCDLGEDQSESENSKSKRIRCVGSDSDFEDAILKSPKGSGSDEEEGEKTTRRRRRRMVIDSDSDAEGNPSDEK